MKIMNKFPQIVKDFIKKFDGKSDMLINFSQGDLYRWINNVYYCGRFSALLFIESLYGLLGRDMPQESYLDWNACKTCAQGVFVICYQDDISDAINKRSLSKFEIGYLKNMLDHIIQHTEKYLGYKTNFARIVSYLCGYFKLYKQTRYLEFYTDRRLGELKHYESALPEYMDLWDKCYAIRKQNVPNDILGELHGWNGVRKEKCKEFVMYGRL